MATFNTSLNDGEWAKEHVIHRRRCLFRSAVVANKGVTDVWIWVCDSNNEGANKPSMCPLLLPAGTTQSIDRSYSPRLMQHGIYVCATLDAHQKTPPASSDIYFEVDYDV